MPSSRRSNETKAMAKSSYPPLPTSALRKSLRCHVIVAPDTFVREPNATLETVRFGSDNPLPRNLAAREEAPACHRRRETPHAESVL
jgi:hypothetical protein